MDEKAVVSLLEPLQGIPFGHVIEILGIIGICWLVHLATRRLTIRVIEKIALRSQTHWDDALHEEEVFERAVAIVPVFIAWQAVEFLLDAQGASDHDLTDIFSRLIIATAVVVVTRGLLALLSAANRIYGANPNHAGRPIKGYVQLVKIAVSVVATILVVAALANESPVIFLSGLGAMTAILLLIFRDTILSLVASVQISGNDMVRVGDWIEMAQFGADGDVIDVALHTVKVQNWDKTITTIPTHRLISDPFKNWRYMSLSGGRRIKRALNIDVSSVRFLSDEEITRWGELELLRDYIAGKLRDIEGFNEGRNRSENADIRRLTNLGTFRTYIELFLKASPVIHQNMTLMVRQLPAGAQGIPLELYCFSNITDWVAYEGIQSDLFDHFIALAPEFGLRVFQSPAGSDLASLAR